ncbi:MAG: PDR/VanB family oxidoreductase [Amphritea sp.]|nr:PDR/VanB family oxidoreductase [Amphritea sp.]
MKQLTPRVRAYELRAVDGSALPVITAGSHLQVPVRLASGEEVIRHYSICSDPAQTGYYEIAVLREDSGTGGSVAVHEQFALGLQLNCGPPQNHFQLNDDEQRVILIAGGIGITPILSMSRTLRVKGQKLHLHYAGRSYDEMAFTEELRRLLGADVSFYSSADQQRMDLEHILSSASDTSHFYICGPARLIDSVITLARQQAIASERIHFERFAVPENCEAGPVELELRRSRITLHVEPDQTLLEAMLNAGIDAPFGCRAGNCKSCATRVLAGEPDHRDAALSDNEREIERLICPCVSRARGRHLVLDR